jgi:hypothetical protein
MQMKRITRSILGALFAAGAILAAPAQAVPIPESAIAGTGLLINFDLTGATPAPPYPVAGYDLTWTGLGAGETIFIDRYLNLNASNFFFSSTINFVTSGQNFVLNFPPFNDGQFSIVLRAAAGTTVDLTSATGLGCASTTNCTPANNLAAVSVALPGAVPEPGTLALLALGLAGLGFGSRKKAQARSA